jgi:hypothetical protein
MRFSGQTSLGDLVAKLTRFYKKNATKCKIIQKKNVSNDWICIVTIIPFFQEVRPKYIKDISSFKINNPSEKVAYMSCDMFKHTGVNEALLAGITILSSFLAQFERHLIERRYRE